jgi:glycosyltransferase involved in cell wall biosynthesis
VSVLFLSIDLFSIGGIQRQSRHELRALRTLLPDTELVVCSFAPPTAKGFAEPLAVDLVGEGTSAAAKARFARRVWQLAARRQVELIICDHINLAPIAWGYHLLTRTPYWVHVHAIDVWGRLRPPRLLALSRANRIYSGAHFTRHYLACRYPHLQDRLVAIGDCVDCERFVPGPADPALRHALRLPPGPILLTVSRLPTDASKGHEVVIEALKLLGAQSTPLRYLIAGEGPDRPRLERLARAQGLADTVVFLGSVADDVLPHLYRLCDVFVLVTPFQTEGTPQGEGIPLVVLEAQASGRPAVTSSRDGSAESIVDGETGLLVDPDQPEALAHALARLLDDGVLQQRMGQAARTHAERHFSFPAFSARVGTLLREATPGLRAGLSIPVVHARGG